MSDTWVPRSFRAEQVLHLLDTQKRAIRLIVARIANVIVESLQYADEQQLAEDATRRNPNKLHLLRPHQVYCIDGARGSGKTYTLATVQYAIHQLERHATSPGKGELQDSSWSTFFQSEALDPALDRGLRVAAEANPTKSFAQVFRILFPGDQENAESLMSAIFSEMNNRLLEQSSRNSKARVEQKAKLLNLITELEIGFEAARKTSQGGAAPALATFDSAARGRRIATLGTADRQSVEHNRIAYNRIARWRDAVRDYLAFFNAATLIILVDDSDVQPELSEDILRTLRNYLTHPRIITVLAGNIRTMRNALLHLSMQRIGRSMSALGTTTYRTARDWRRSERRTVEEYIDKILPPAQRFFLAPPEFHAIQPAEKESDFAKIAGCELLDICKGRLLETRHDFLTAKFALALRREVELLDQPTEEQEQAIEGFLSWWMFANQYAAELAPRSVRQIMTFRDYYVEIKEGKNRQFSPKPKAGKAKRLPVMLHDVSDNFAIIQRLEDTDVSVTAWLREQELSSTWSSQRSFHINSRETFQGSYSYDYLRYRIDVGLATPVRDNPDEALPAGLLPKFRGRRFVRRFFMPQNMLPQQRRYGVAQRVDHAALPGNCLYFYDLAAIPDVSIFPSDKEATKDAEPPGIWESLLAGRWPEYVNIDANNALISYFTEVLCERLRHTELITSATLMRELNPPKDKGKRGLYDASVESEFASFAENWGEVWTRAIRELIPDASQPSGNQSRLQAAGRARYRTSQRASSVSAPQQSKTDQPGEAQAAQTPDKVSEAKHLLARYSAMLTDLRRAWHAVRIHEHAPKYMESGAEITARGYERAARAVIANQSRMNLYTRGDLEQILRKSSWTNAILDSTEPKRILPRWQDETRHAGGPDDVKLEFLFRVDEPIKIEDKEEEGDWETWARTLRRAGRALSKTWPVYDGSDQGLAQIGFDTQPNGHPEPWQLAISKNTQPDEPELVHSREARNFLLFMHGLAPSLPAIIHLNVMARVYEANPTTETKQTLSRHGGSEENRKVGLETRWLPQHIWHELEEQLTAWGSLIGALSLAVRYVKIQSLNLFAKLLIKSALEPGNEQSLEQNGSKFVNECFSGLSSIWTKDVFIQLRNLFGPEISTGLALMPDIAPSSLFGERWMNDLITTSFIRQTVLRNLARLHPDGNFNADVAPEKAEDVAKNVKGIFGETELWLWCANRCLRKLYGVLKKQAEGKTN